MDNAFNVETMVDGQRFVTALPVLLLPTNGLVDGGLAGPTILVL